MTRTRMNVPGLLFIAGVIAVWQIATTVGPWAELGSLPSPMEIISAFKELQDLDALIPPVLHTIRVSLIAAAIGIFAGTCLGLLLGMWPLFRTFTGSSFDVLRTIPVVSIMPVLLLVFGAEPRTEILVGAIASTWPMLVNTADGVRLVHPRIGEVGRMFGFGRIRSVRKLILPAIVPNLLVGARLAVITALIATIIAEMIIVPAGLGWSLASAQNALQTAQMWVFVIVCGWLGWVANIGLTILVDRLQPGRAR